LVDYPVDGGSVDGGEGTVNVVNRYRHGAVGVDVTSVGSCGGEGGEGGPVGGREFG